MKILVFSDSHGKTTRMLNIIDEQRREIDAIIHLGDTTADCDDIRYYDPELTLYSVNGNNGSSENAPDELLIELAGNRLLLAHGHIHRVRWGLDSYIAYAKEKGARAALFGHTHRPLCEENNGILLLNPGSITRPSSGRPSYAVLTLSEGTGAQAEIVYI